MASEESEQQQVSPSGFGVGATLKAARERMGKSLPECAEQLRIRRPFLEALEESRHKDLPGGTYAIGFLRTYAEFLSLDGEEMVRRFRSEGAGDFGGRSELIFPSPVSEGRIPGGAVIFLGLLLASLAYGGWYWLSSRETKVAETVPGIPDRLTSVLSRPATLTGEAAKPADATPTTAPEPAKPAEEQPKAREEVVPPPEAEEDKTPPARAPVAAPQAPAPAPAAPAPAAPVPAPAPAAATLAPEPAKPAEEARPAEGDGRVLLKAAGDDCWIQVREMDGSLLVSRLLRRGDSYRVPSRAGLSLMVGNAGALEVTVDGRKTPSLGSAGQVKRDIRLDPDKLLTGG